MAELNRAEKKDSIKDLTAKYSQGSDVDDELAALKASLGKA